MFSHVRILIAINPAKQCLLNEHVRMSLIEQDIKGIPNVSVDFTDSFVVDYARRIGASFLLRGIRNESDVLYEMKIAEENRRLAPEIQTVFLPADPKVADVSSSKLKEMIQSQQNVGKFCSAATELVVRQRLADVERMNALFPK